MSEPSLALCWQTNWNNWCLFCSISQQKKKVRLELKGGKISSWSVSCLESRLFEGFKSQIEMKYPTSYYSYWEMEGEKEREREWESGRFSGKIITTPVDPVTSCWSFSSALLRGGSPKKNRIQWMFRYPWECPGISLVGEFYSGRRPQEKVWGRFGDLFSFVLLLSTVFYNVPSPVVILTMFEPLIISVSHS